MSTNQNPTPEAITAAAEALEQAKAALDIVAAVKGMVTATADRRTARLGVLNDAIEEAENDAGQYLDLVFSYLGGDCETGYAATIVVEAEALAESMYGEGR